MVRGGLTIGAGIVAGNVLGVARVALTAYLLGTQNSADALAVGIGSLDSLNQVVISTMIFAFVPLLAERAGAQRVALFHRLNRIFLVLFFALSTLIFASASLLIRWLAPGLAATHVAEAVNILRIGALSTFAIGATAIRSALLYTDREFGPSAFHQATLNVGTLAGALLLWKPLGVYGFAIGYALGAWMQFGVVTFASRRHLQAPAVVIETPGWFELMTRPSAILIYSAMITLNVTATRAYATHLGPGTAAAFEYCMRCLGAPLAFLVSPITNSLLPEIARLRSVGKMRDAFRLTDRMIAITAAVSIAAATLGVVVRRPVIALLFERGSFTAQSTDLVAAVFLGFAPILVGWSLMELVSRSTFALDHTWLPMMVSAAPAVINVAVLSVTLTWGPQYLGLGASAGFLFAFAVLYGLVRSRRETWIAES